MNRDVLVAVNKCLQEKKNVVLTGLAGTAKAFVLNEVYKAAPGKILCLVSGEEKAYDLARDLQGFAGRDKIFMFLERSYVFLKENYSSAETGRILTLQECLLHPKRRAFIIATPASLMYRILSPQHLRENTVNLKTGSEKPVEDILKQLVRGGYKRVNTVTRPGEFALRGGILDIYPSNSKDPYRVEFFGDCIESIRRFDADSQRSGKKEPAVNIIPADELHDKKLDSSLFNYLHEGTRIFFDEPRDFYRAFDRETKRFEKLIKEMRKENREIRALELLDRESIAQQAGSFPVIYHSFFSGNIPQVKTALIEHISQKEMEHFYGSQEILFSRLREWLEKKYTVRLAVKNREAREQIKKELHDRRMGGIDFTDLEIERGFSSQTLKLAVVAEKDIWKDEPRRRVGRRKKTEERLLVEDLKRGDYVVHENYGIGVFRGVAQVENDGVTREYILLEYAGSDKLYLPVDKLDCLHKYNASGEKEPRLSKLGGTAWEKTRRKVEESIQEMAEELLHIYASRLAREGYAFSPDTPWQKQFETAFPYEETPDQLKAISDVKKDMESNRPMDRLICGDVGYGKTEVAMRAAFKAVMDGKQTAVLVPTTILAEQHYQTFQQRFEGYPTIIEVLSRFRTLSEQKRIIADLKKGVIDIVIGTHRLLSRDVGFRDLGLLIIDEEHRFGVAQKEKIRSYRELVDVISLSATPIPRTLHMALTGLRDLSIIDTPPPERYPIATYVMAYNEEIIAEAVRNEIERGGQVFFVHNRIEDIYRVKEELETLLPHVAIGVGHGRMKEDELARVMVEFSQGRYRLFLCTAIIESGLDMPNVNTIIVDEADRMGLAQLYQLRGRVGRSNRIAYAYLTYRPDRVITEDAQKRLNAIREFSELGSGMRIALRDLEIRGAGNILGAEQHGHIQAVGFDMYCRLLEQETARLQGKTLQERVSPQLDVDVDYYIPDSYIPDSGTKIRIYRRLLLAQEGGEIEDIRAELLDRFGAIPQPVENFLQIAALRIKARNAEIKNLRRKGSQIEIQLARRLPEDLPSHSGDLKIKKINPTTLLVQGGGNSLEPLKTVLDMI